MVTNDSIRESSFGEQSAKSAIPSRVECCRSCFILVNMCNFSV